LAPQVTDPPKQRLRRISQPLPDTHVGMRFTKAGVFSLLILIALLLVVFSGQLLVNLFQVNGSHASAVIVSVRSKPNPRHKKSTIPTPTPTYALDTTSPIISPGNGSINSLQLPAGYSVVYQQADGLYIVSSADNVSHKIPASGYVYSEAVPPILMPSGQLLYSGDGIWLIDPFEGTPLQIAALPPGQVITSMALSKDGTRIAWSTDPVDGTGNTSIYAGPLASPTMVYEQPALDCPCYRIFSFAGGSEVHADNTLFLTDDRGSNEAVQYGLWSLDITQTPAEPQLILDENPQQGPLALTPNGNGLLYSSNEGAVPMPTDSSVPTSIASLSYANDLNLTALSGSSQPTGSSQTVLEKQDDLSNIAQYHWVTTPLFSPDAHTLAYIEFSSDSQDPYDRHSALYTVQISGSGTHIHASKPKLIATSIERLMELGAWINSHIITFYSDGSLYALDVQMNALTTLVQTNTYANVVAVIGSP
jgi:hypothetical protein